MKNKHPSNKVKLTNKNTTCKYGNKSLCVNKQVFQINNEFMKKLNKKPILQLS